MSEMLRARLLAPQQVVLETVPVPSPGPGEALVKVAVVGICGSDIHAYFGRHPFITCPVVPGHEFSGVVAAVGAGVPESLAGKRATALPSLVCGQCLNCRTGRFNICDKLKVVGCQADGALAEYVVTQADKIVPVPDSLTFEEAALVEPLAVAVHAVRRGGLVAGKRILVFGAGPIGLLVAQVAKAYGAGQVIISDLSEDRLRLAQALGADPALNPRRHPVLDYVRAKSGPEGVDVSFECAGAEATIDEAIRASRKGARIVVAGVFEAEIRVKMGLVQDRELELRGTLMYTSEDYTEALRLLETGAVKVLPLVTHRFELSQVAEAFETIRTDSAGAVKVLVRVG